MTAVYPTEAFDDAPCPCCGKTTRVLRGKVEDDWGQLRYTSFFTPGRALQDGATFDFIEHTQPLTAVSTTLSYNGSGPWFGVTDVPEEKATASGFAWKTRADVIGTPLAGRIFAAIDAVWIGEPGLAEFYRTV